MYEAGSEQVICNGAIIELPTLEVVKPVPAMPGDSSIDWLLHIYYTRRDFVRCHRIIEQELNRTLNPAYLYFIKGLLEREQSNYVDALKHLQRAVELDVNNIETYKEIGRTLYTMGRHQQALSVFRDAERRAGNRRDHEIFYYLGELLYRSASGQSELQLARKLEAEAINYFELAVHTGKKPESYVRLAQLLRRQKQYQKAIDILESCLHLMPDSAEVLTEISVLYLKINETQKAYDRLSEVNNIQYKCPKGLLALGAILQSRNDVDGALSKYSEIADAEPEIAELWNNIGLCFFKKQKFIVAISSLRKSVWLSPLSYNALYNLSLIYITSEQYASAFHTLAAAINLRKNNAECYMLLGLCLRKLDDVGNAFIALERACNIANANGTTRNPIIFLNFALFCYETGRLAMAAEQYNKFISNAQDILLPTELKFQSTKLKSLLRLSNIDANILNENIQRHELELTANGGQDGEEDENENEHARDLLPLEVNAVVA